MPGLGAELGLALTGLANVTIELALREHQMSTLRATFLIATHHGVTLKPADLPRLADGDMLPSVASSLTQAGFRTRLLQRGTWATAAGLGSAYPAMIPMKDGSWVILILVTAQDGNPVAAILDPAQEAQGVQMMPRARFLAEWSGRILLVQRKAVAATAPQDFGLAWFMPALWSQAGLLAGVTLAVIVGNLISFS